MTSDGTATGDFGSHYKVDVTSVTSGSSMAEANGTHKVSMEGVWKGPCPAGMKGGDMEMAGGMRISTSGGVAHMESGPGGVDMAKLRAQAMSGHVDQAEIAKMKAQAEAMKARPGIAAGFSGVVGSLFTRCQGVRPLMPACGRVRL